MSAIGIKMEVEEGASATVSELILALVDEEELNLPRQTTTTSNTVTNSSSNGGSGTGVGGSIISLGEIFTLWMTSPLLDVQLKPHHKVCHYFHVIWSCLTAHFKELNVMNPTSSYISSHSTSEGNGITSYKDFHQRFLNGNRWMNRFYHCKEMYSFIKEMKLS